MEVARIQLEAVRVGLQLCLALGVDEQAQGAILHVSPAEEPHRVLEAEVRRVLLGAFLGRGPTLLGGLDGIVVLAHASPPPNERATSTQAPKAIADRHERAAASPLGAGTAAGPMQACAQHPAPAR